MKSLEGRNALDSYSLAHLGEAQQRIAKAVDAIYVYNMPSSFGGGGGGFIILGQDGQPTPAQQPDSEASPVTPEPQLP